MKVSLLLASLLLFLGAALASDVLDLTSENFDETLTANPVILVEFFAPWCGHCKNLAPKYEAAATKLKGIAPIAKVDCTAQDSLCQRFGIRGYPTLKVFRNGKPSDYGAAREEDAIISFMKKQVLPAMTVLEADKVQDFSESERVVVIGYFANEDAKEAKTFSQVANSLRDDFVFGVTYDEAAATAAGVSAPAVVLYKKFDEGKNIFEESITKSALTAFIKASGVPTMDDLGPENYATYAESGLPLAYLFVTPHNRGLVGPSVEAVAKEFKGKVNFVYIDGDKYGGHANNVGLKVGEWPAFTIQYPKENSKFPLVGEISTESVRAHVTAVLAGEAQPFTKTQPIPTEQGNVKVVVGANYKDITSQGKDVLIEFYAPWCGHCKKLVPIYDELGDFYADSETIVIAKMDATENDLPAGTPFQIQGFPTIKFIKADGSIIDYNGDRSLEDFKKFISQNASTKLSSSSSSSKKPTKEEL